MCTVTFIPLGDHLYLTSNRDEKKGRPSASKPAIVRMETGHLLFPRDAQAGGTWFAVHEQGHALVLLNGGWNRHTPRPSYRRSRGLVLLDLADSPDPADSFLSLPLTDIEPFTIVILQEGELTECRWDGEDKYHTRLDAGLPHIWSSVTLYDPATIAKRKKWFEQWLDRTPKPSGDMILDFHRFTGDGDPNNDLLMRRGDGMLTVSITSLQWTHREAQLQYLDRIGRQSGRQHLLFNKASLENS